MKRKLLILVTQNGTENEQTLKHLAPLENISYGISLHPEPIELLAQQSC